MPIGTNNLIDFHGTPDALDTSSSDVTDGSFSDGTNDLIAWTNDDDAELASAILEANFSVAPDVGSGVDLFARLIDIISTNDAEVPQADFPHVWLGQFPLNDVTTAQFHPIEIELPNTKTSQIYHFYIRNNAGATLPGGWDLTIIPKAKGPHA